MYSSLMMKKEVSGYAACIKASQYTTWHVNQKDVSENHTKNLDMTFGLKFGIIDSFIITQWAHLSHMESRKATLFHIRYRHM